MLTKAGFTPYKPNMETPKTQALLDALPDRQVTTFMANGVPYHAYPDKRSNVLYVGDEAAYQKYVSMAQGRNLCQRVEAPDSAGFWGRGRRFHPTPPGGAQDPQLRRSGPHPR